MASTSSALYSLPRGAEESARLDAQHRTYLASVGYFLNPDLESRIPKDAVIADVGTGTGIWLLELAAKPKSVKYTFEGLDVSDAQFPKTYPQNMSFKQFNLLKPVPPEFADKYDVVHIRLITGGLDGKDDWKTATTNVLKLLKPGGFVQWEEGDYQHIRVLKNDPNADVSSLTALRDLGVDLNLKYGKTLGIVSQLGKMLSEAGFNDVHQEAAESDRERQLQGFSQVTMKALLGTITWHASQPGSTVDMAKVHKLYAQCQEAIKDDAAYYHLDIYYARGQKP